MRLPYALWLPFGEIECGTQRRSALLGESRPPTEMEYHATLNVSDYRTFRKYWRAIVGPSKESRRLRTAVSRLVRARSAHFAEDVIVHCFIGLEALFADHTKEAGKTVGKVRRRLTTFIIPADTSPTVAELTTLQNRIGEIYELRHDILHGDLPEESKTKQAAKDSIQLLRTAISIALEEGFRRLKCLNDLAADYDKSLQAAQRAEKRAARHKK